MNEFEDDFNGNNAALLRSIGALLTLDARDALVPHGIGGHARGLLSAAAVRIVELERVVACFDYHRNDSDTCDLCHHEGGKIGDRLDVYLLTSEERAELGAPAYDKARGYHYVNAPRSAATVNSPTPTTSTAEVET